MEVSPSSSTLLALTCCPDASLSAPFCVRTCWFAGGDTRSTAAAGGCRAATGLDAVCVISGGSRTCPVTCALLAEESASAGGGTGDLDFRGRPRAEDVEPALLGLFGAASGSSAGLLGGKGDLLLARSVLPPFTATGLSVAGSVCEGGAGDGTRERASSLMTGSASPASGAGDAKGDAALACESANSCSAPRVSGELARANASESALSSCIPSWPSTSRWPLSAGGPTCNICAFQPSISGGSPSDMAVSSRSSASLAGRSASSARPLPLSSAGPAKTARAVGCGPRSRSGLGSIDVSDEESEKSNKL